MKRTLPTLALLLLLTTAKSQNARSYDTNEWIPITKSPNDETPTQKRPTGRVLNLPSENTNQKNFFPEENRSKNKPPVVEQYLRETTQVAPQRENQQYLRQQVRFQERPQIQEQPKYYLIPKQREQLYLQQQEEQRQHVPQQHQTPKNPFDSYLNLSLAPYQSLRPDTINQELIAALNKPPQISSTTPKATEETIQLLYVPVETLTKKEQQPPSQQRHDWNAETRREPQYVPHNPNQHRLQNIQTDFAKQALEAHRLQMQLQTGNYPSIYTTTTATPKPKKRKPHQPPLALYMGAHRELEVSDVLEELKHADTIAVQDNVGPDSPKVFVGPSNLDVPRHYSKFELPYLNTVDNNRIQRKVDHLPFFVAPLSYKAPPGFSKIPLPSPHVGSVVVSTRTTSKIPTIAPPVIEEVEDDSSEEKYKYVPHKSEVDDEIERRLAQTESLLQSQTAKKKPLSYTVRSKSSSSYSPNPEHIKPTTEEPTRQKVYSFEEPQHIRVSTERTKSRPRTYTYSFEEPQEIHITSERPSRPRTYQQEEQIEKATSERPSRVVTYSFEEPQEIRISTQRPLPSRTYSFEETQPVRVSTESSRHRPSSEEEPERKQQVYRPSSREEEDEEEEEEAPKRQPTAYSTTERFVEKETENKSRYKKPSRQNDSEEQRDEEPRRKPARTREDSGESEDPPPRRQNTERETSRSSPHRYETSATRPVKDSSEEKADDDEQAPPRKERPTKITYEDSYHSAPTRQSSYEESNKQPYQTSNRFVSTTPVYLLRTTEDGGERPAYVTRTTDYSPTLANYDGTYRNLNEYNVRTSTPKYAQQKEEPQVYSVTTGRPYQVSASSEAPNYQTKYSPYINLDVHVKSPGHESSIYDLSDHKPSGPSSYEQSPKSRDRESYNLPAHLPDINPEIPGLINNLQDQSIRQLLVPGLLVPTTEHLPVYKRPETTTPDYVSLTTFTTTPEPIIETTTQKRVRSRQRGGNRFSSSPSRSQDSSGEVTPPPRRTPQRSRRPHTRQRNEHRREEHEHTTEYTPVRVNHDYTTTEASRRDITHSPRQRVRSRTRPPHHESHEESRHVEETPKTTPHDQDQSTENILQRSGEHPVTETRSYQHVYNAPLQEASSSSKEDNRPAVDAQVTHPEEYTETPQFHSQPAQESSSEEVTTTPKSRSRQRTRSRARVVSATTKQTTVPTTTAAPQTKEENKEEEFYGFIRPPVFNKGNVDVAIPTVPTEAPAYTDFDKRFKIPSYTFNFPAYGFDPSTQSHDDYYKELEAAGREPIQLYSNDKHLSSTPLYVYKPKYILQTEDEQNLPATVNPLRPPKEEKSKARTRVPQRRNQEEDGQSSAATFNERRGSFRNNERTRNRGKSHFQLPASLRTASEEEEIQNSNYPADFLQKQASATQSSIFQITVEPQTQDSEYDQQPHPSIQRPSIALPDEPNTFAVADLKKQLEETSTIQTNVEETDATTLPPPAATETEKKKRRGVWKLVKQRPVDNFETAESQNYHTALQLTTQEKKKKGGANLFDTLYEMFSSPEKDEASTEANTGSVQMQSTNNTSSEEIDTTTLPAEATTVIPLNEETTVSETVTTEAAEETTTTLALKPYEVQPWEMKAVKTSTTTEVSHETEICFRGRCVKSSGIAETPA